MPRYLVERTFPDGLGITPDDDGARACLSVVQNNAEAGVTWLHSYVTDDRRKTFCLYDGPSPEAIRETAARNGLPVDSIVAVRVLDPYFHYAAA
jgi:Nickel responsive protein SCO4226-like